MAQSRDRSLSAEALFRMAASYEKLGSAEARRVYERVVGQFGDQKDVAAAAGRRLAALGDPGGTGQTATRTERIVWTENALLLSVTPDGRWMGSSPKQGIAQIRDLLTNKIALEMTDSDAPLISSDGQTIVFNYFGTDGLVPAGSQAAQLRIMGVAPGSKPRVLVSSEEIRYCTPLAWSIDGSSILTQIRRADNTWQIGWVSRSDGEIRVLKSLDWRLQGVNSRPSLSPNGRYIAYSALSNNPSVPVRTPASRRSESRDQDIYILSLDDMTEKPVTKGGSINESPIWTPDGNHIVFTSDRTGTFALYSVAIRDGDAAGFPLVVNKDVGRIRPVNAMTRSGSFYYSVDRQSEVLIAEMEPKNMTFRGYGTNLAESFTGLRPAWAPDGESIAFTILRPSGEGYDLIVRSLKTGKAKTYPTGDADFRMAQVLRWFQDGSKLLQGKGGLPLYLVDLERGDFREVVGYYGATYGLGGISPDSSVLYALALDSEERDPLTRNVLTRISRIVPTRIAKSANDPFQIAVTPDSNTLMRERRQAVNFPDPQRARHGYVMPEGVSDFALSPDGRTIAFTTWPDPKTGEVYLGRINAADGANYRKLYGPFRSDVSEHKIVWTSDGRTLLFGKSDANDRWQIMKISAEGGKAESTGLEIERLRNFDLSTDGSRIAFEAAPRSPQEVRAFDNIPSILSTLR